MNRRSMEFSREGRVMCGIVGVLDKTGELEGSSGRVLLNMLEALACRGPDGAGVAMIGRGGEPTASDSWLIRVAGGDEPFIDRLAGLGRIMRLRDGSCWEQKRDSARFRFAPEPGVTADDIEFAIGARRGGIEILSLGNRLDLVKQVGSPGQLEAAYGVSKWTGPVAIGHTRLSTESRIDLSHSQPFWVHGVPDIATVHNGHITNYHQLRRRYEQRGVVFYTDNDSEVIGVYLRDRMEHGLSLPEAIEDSVVDLDGAFNYLVASPHGLGVVRDQYGFKPLVLAETDDWVAVATEEIALRRALPGDFETVEPFPGSAVFYPSSEDN
jgi:glutamate synthase domain-containing protein 1